MHPINIEILTKVLMLPNLGRKKALKIFSQLNYNINDDLELFNFIKDNSEKYSLPQYNKNEWEKVSIKYEKILLLNEKLKIKTISIFDPKYPKMFNNMNDSPLLINFRGNISSLNDITSVAIVGTRNPSDQGRLASARFGALFGELKFNVVSGLALGCDTAAHSGYLIRNGFTTAILAHGLDQINPREMKYLADEILEKGGLLLSEYNAGQKPQVSNFIERNRLQAGLSNAVIVIETDVKGGTMHTVNFGQKYNRLIGTFIQDTTELPSFKIALGNQMLSQKKIAKPLTTPADIQQFIELIQTKYSTHF